MQQDYTHIAVILDRTGSMEVIRDDTIGGFNAFLAEQQAQPGKATLTLVQFDSQDPYEVVHRFADIADVPELTRETFVPRASTPLLDAMGRGINDLEKCLADLPKKKRPAKVIFAVVTDGQENASREFTKDQVEKMVREHQEKDDWQIVFLSADMAAIDEARGVGVRAHAVRAFSPDRQGTQTVWKDLSARTAGYRSGKISQIGFQPADTPEDDEEDEDESEE